MPPHGQAADDPLSVSEVSGRTRRYPFIDSSVFRSDDPSALGRSEMRSSKLLSCWDHRSLLMPFHSDKPRELQHESTSLHSIAA